MRQGAERLLEAPHSLTVGRPRQGPVSRLSAVCQGLVPHFTLPGMVRQSLNELVLPVASVSQGPQRCVRAAPVAAPEETAVGHLVGQGMLEGVFAFGEEPRLVEELGGLEVRQSTLQGLLRQIGNGL